MFKSLVISLSILPLLVLVGCSGEQPEQAAAPTPGAGQATPPPAPVPPVVNQAPVPPAISSADISAVGLIPSTDPTDRLADVQKTRTNPFSLMKVPPINAPERPKPISTTTTGSTTEKGKISTKGKPIVKGVKAIKNGQKGVLVGGKFIQEVPPPPPNTKEAEGVKVYGIIDFAEYPVAIIQTANEPVAQSVRSRTSLRDPLKPYEIVAVESIQADGISLVQNGETIIRKIGDENLPPNLGSAN